MLAAALAVVCLSALGDQPKSQGSVAAHCEKDVRDYVQAIQFIRESAGSQISGRVVAGYVDERTVREVQQNQGVCAAADLIRTKTASRKN
jgi:hypothetical protein